MAQNGIMMDVTFVLRGTFIDEASPCQQQDEFRRAVSEPASPIVRLDAAQEVLHQVECMSGYVSSLTDARNAAFGDSPASSGEGVEASFADVAPSCGSRGHPQLCKRPCIYYAGGKCTSGAQCNYCHLGHSERPAKLDKQQRLKFAAMPPREAMDMIHAVLKTNADENGFASLATEILDLVQLEACRHVPHQKDSSLAAMQRRLQRVLVRMPFHQLALLAVSKTGSESFREDLECRLDELTASIEMQKSAGCEGM
mmetsp:Transcript_19574/g.45511  ORF Transcript_19574/g.45511 Transcript_19574/m.45511 type:complete len:255 (+) Transcript_19574:72-836(+)